MSQFDDELDFDWGEPPIHFVPERLILFRICMGMTSARLSRAVRASRAAVSYWENGTKQPTKFLPLLAMTIDVTASGFGMPAPAAVSAGPFFRSTNISAANYTDQATSVARLVTDVATYFDRAVDMHLPALPAFPGVSPSGAAQKLRAAAAAPAGPISNTVRLARAVGAIATYAPKLKSAIDAYSVVAGRWPLIILTPKGDFYRQRWDVAHELGHLVMGHSLAETSRDIEAEAHQFAAELLAPADQIRSELPSSINGTGVEQLQALKECWGISISALVRRAHELGVMNDVEFGYANIYIAEHGYRSHEPGRIQTLEMAVAIPDAFDTYLGFGFDREIMWREAGVPRSVFDAAVSRVPLDLSGSTFLDH